MDCPRCGSEADSSFMQETFPCAHCDCVNLITYHLCPSCSLMWRDINGAITTDSVVSAEEIMEALKPSEEDMEILESLNDFAQKMGRKQKGEVLMSDYIHRCLRCNSIANEVGDGVYKCLVCGFEWEMHNLG